MKFLKIAVMLLSICLLAVFIGCAKTENNSGESLNSIEPSSSHTSPSGNEDANNKEEENTVLGGSEDTSGDDEQKNESGTVEEKYYQQVFAKSASGAYNDEVINRSRDEIKTGKYKIIWTSEELCQHIGEESGAEAEIFENNCVIYISIWYSTDWGEGLGFKNLTFSGEGAAIEYDRPYYEGEEMIEGEAVTHYEDYIVVDKDLIPSGVSNEGAISATQNKKIVSRPKDEGYITETETVTK